MNLPAGADTGPGLERAIVAALCTAAGIPDQSGRVAAEASTLPPLIVVAVPQDRHAQVAAQVASWPGELDAADRLRVRWCSPRLTLEAWTPVPVRDVASVVAIAALSSSHMWESAASAPSAYASVTADAAYRLLLEGPFTSPPPAGADPARVDVLAALLSDGLPPDPRPLLGLVDLRQRTRRLAGVLVGDLSLLEVSARLAGPVRVSPASSRTAASPIAAAPER